MRDSTAALLEAVRSGVNRIGEISIQSFDSNDCFKLSHHMDASLAALPDHGGLETFEGPSSARQISLFSEDGEYRFLKALRNLKRGWVMILRSGTDLRLALDQFYPAALGMWLSHRDGTLEIENLREKLDRQTGMYRRAKMIHDERAQVLVAATCASGPGCARKILWSISPTQPLIPSPASTCKGRACTVPPESAIPLLCASPCNHFVAECLVAAKQQPPTPTAP